MVGMKGRTVGAAWSVALTSIHWEKHPFPILFVLGPLSYGTVLTTFRMGPLLSVKPLEASPRHTQRVLDTSEGQEICKILQRLRFLKGIMSEVKC